MVEEWRSVPGYEGQYEVSSLGRVRSLDRPVRIRGGSYRVSKGRVLTPLRHTGGYDAVHLGRKNQRLVHELVALAFIGDRPPGAVTRHLDGDPTNNRVDNLAWGTQSENMRDVARYDRPISGRVGLEALSEIRSRLSRGEACVDIAICVGVNPNAVYKIKSGRTFAYIK